MLNKRAVYIVIPAYNAEKTIEKAICSVLTQQGVDVRVLVIDHGSSDETVAITSKYVRPGILDLISIPRKLTDRKSASRPLAYGINHLIDCKYDSNDMWFMRLDADDVLASNSSVELLLSRSTGKELIIGRIVFFDNNRHTSETYTVKPDCRSRETLLCGAAYSIPHHASLIHFKLLQRVREKRGFVVDEQLSYGEDLDFTIGLLKECDKEKLSFVDLDFYYKRLDGTTISNTSKKISIALDHIHLLRRHRLICSELFARVLADLILQQLGFLNSPIRTWLGYPGLRWAEIYELPYDMVQRRLDILESMQKK